MLVWPWRDTGFLTILPVALNSLRSTLVIWPRRLSTREEVLNGGGGTPVTIPVNDRSDCVPPLRWAGAGKGENPDSLECTAVMWFFSRFLLSITDPNLPASWSLWKHSAFTAFMASYSLFWKHFIEHIKMWDDRGFPGGAVVENLPANAGDTGSSPGLGRSHMPRSN